MSVSDPLFDGFFKIAPDEVSPAMNGPPGEVWGIYEDNDATKRLLVVADYRTNLAEHWR